MSATVQPGKDLHVADQTSHDAKPCSGFRGLAPADGALGFDGAVACHSALLLGDDLSSRPALGGGGNLDTQAGSLGDKYASPNSSSPAVSSLGRSNSRGFGLEPSIPSPSGSIASPVPALKSLNLAQAILDGLATLVCFLFLAIMFGSLPLAIGLLIFAEFH
jgi:hypothetical protein